MIPIPAFLTARLMAGVAVAAALVLSGWMARAKWDAGRFTKLELQQSQRVAEAEKKARTELEKARERETALIETTRGIVDEARKTVETLERGRADADRASVSMLDAARRAAGRCSPGANAAPATGGGSANLPSSMSDGDRFLRVFGELDGFAGAAAADSGRARAARNACEQAYNAALKAVNR
jgi:hypothetical protein